MQYAPASAANADGGAPPEQSGKHSTLNGARLMITASPPRRKPAMHPREPIGLVHDLTAYRLERERREEALRKSMALDPESYRQFHKRHRVPEAPVFFEYDDTANHSPEAA